jgi:hypothetical protein
MTPKPERRPYSPPTVLSSTPADGFSYGMHERETGRCAQAGAAHRSAGELMLFRPENGAKRLRSSLTGPQVASTPRPGLAVQWCSHCGVMRVGEQDAFGAIRWGQWLQPENAGG